MSGIVIQPVSAQEVTLNYQDTYFMSPKCRMLIVTEDGKAFVCVLSPIANFELK